MALTSSLLPLLPLLLLTLSSSAVAGKCNKDDKEALVAITPLIRFPTTNSRLRVDETTRLLPTGTAFDCDGLSLSVCGLASAVFADDALTRHPPAPQSADLPFSQTLVYHKLPRPSSGRHPRLFSQSVKKLSPPLPQLETLSSAGSVLPSQIQSLTDLADLSFNKINAVGGLVLFNVSYNRLCGEIPSGSVTAKFDEFSYLHNKCLCGAPLPACKSD
ncbi:uncharacterized protein LOC109823566 [Asparagus officinalis]|uniref:uncharacterized protein LOC109823566 n=1 Tax=Asparagus officinalis TaxID=4686 RepID=UPI00098E00DB|nr:uncharacterized protein LOC109823566 [Asparagus officinalis]